MAENFTILPNFAQQESNTAVLPNGDFNDELLKSARLNYAMKEAKHEADQKKLAESIDFKTGDILQSDLSVIDKSKEEYINWLRDNAQKLAANDLMTLAKQKEIKNNIDSKVDIAIGRKQWYDKQNTYLTTNDARNTGYGTQTDFKKLQEYKDKPFSEWGGYDPRDLFNEIEFFGLIDVKPQTTTTDTGTTKTTTSETPAEDIIASIGQLRNTPIQYNRFAQHYLDLASQAKGNPAYDATITYYDPNDFAANGSKATPKTIKLSQIGADNVDLLMYQKPYLDKVYQKNISKDVNAPTSSGGSGSGGSGKNNTITYQQGLNVPTRGNMMSGGKNVGVQTQQIPASGWDLSGTANKPSNINIKAPTTAIPLSSGEYNDLNDKTIDLSGGVPFDVKNPESWNVDVIGVYDINVTDTGKPIFNSKIKGTKKRFALVKKGDRDFLIPYDDNIKNPLQTAGINLEELTQTAPTNNTSTTTNNSGKKYKGLDKNGNPIFE